MKKIFWFVMVTLFMNFATGFLCMMFPGDTTNPDVSLREIDICSFKSGLYYNKQELSNYDLGEANISPTSTLDPSTGFFRLWDFFNLGYIKKLIDIFNVGLFGFPQMLINIFGTVMSAGMFNFLNVSMKILFTTLYSIAGFILFTGRNPFFD